MAGAFRARRAVLAEPGQLVERALPGGLVQRRAGDEGPLGRAAFQHRQRRLHQPGQQRQAALVQAGDRLQRDRALGRGEGGIAGRVMQPGPADPAGQIVRVQVRRPAADRQRTRIAALLALAHADRQRQQAPEAVGAGLAAAALGQAELLRLRQRCGRALRHQRQHMAEREPGRQQLLAQAGDAAQALQRGAVVPGRLGPAAGRHRPQAGMGLEQRRHQVRGWIDRLDRGQRRVVGQLRQQPPFLDGHRQRVAGQQRHQGRIAAGLAQQRVDQLAHRQPVRAAPAAQAQLQAGLQRLHAHQRMQPHQQRGVQAVEQRTLEHGLPLQPPAAAQPQRLELLRRGAAEQRQPHCGAGRIHVDEGHDAHPATEGQGHLAQAVDLGQCLGQPLGRVASQPAQPGGGVQLGRHRPVAAAARMSGQPALCGQLIDRAAHRVAGGGPALVGEPAGGLQELVDDGALPVAGQHGQRLQHIALQRRQILGTRNGGGGHGIHRGPIVPLWWRRSRRGLQVPRWISSIL